MREPARQELTLQEWQRARQLHQVSGRQELTWQRARQLLPGCDRLTTYFTFYFAFITKEAFIEAMYVITFAVKVLSLCW